MSYAHTDRTEVTMRRIFDCGHLFTDATLINRSNAWSKWIGHSFTQISLFAATGWQLSVISMTFMFNSAVMCVRA